ncbi:hypothetical protein DFP72DRAFT_1063650 [Ephemerocybe angulata]|uniref:Membrane-associated proteins in eicosanoid and glutathione metabolism n=1 Tax=Ephemerocybe angulata TaxID=980116 RepID=A0A8H6I9S7_9AGAR|nr:hypothetical protein DFP72DRAFT_1063650 [Tulosesus angulatus]
MSLITVTIPADFKYVGLALVSTTWLMAYQYRIVSQARKKAGILYPQAYAEKAEMKASEDARLFNCAQRANGNTMENIPLVFTNTIVVGLRWPLLGAALCGTWVIGKFAYTNGYMSGDPEKRVNTTYKVGSAALGGLTLLTTYIALEWAFKDLITKALGYL